MKALRRFISWLLCGGHSWRPFRGIWMCETCGALDANEKKQ